MYCYRIKELCIKLVIETSLNVLQFSDRRIVQIVQKSLCLLLLFNCTALKDSKILKNFMEQKCNILIQLETVCCLRYV